MILELKENEIKEPQNKLETISKEHELCLRESLPNIDQLKSVKIEPAASEALSEEDDDENCKKVDESSISEKKTNGQKRKGKTKTRSTVKKLNFKLKSSVQVEL